MHVNVESRGDREEQDHEHHRHITVSLRRFTEPPVCAALSGPCERLDDLADEGNVARSKLQGTDAGTRAATRVRVVVTEMRGPKHRIRRSHGMRARRHDDPTARARRIRALSQRSSQMRTSAHLGLRVGVGQTWVH
jgi:hypothetical protein